MKYQLCLLIFLCLLAACEETSLYKNPHSLPGGNGSGSNYSDINFSGISSFGQVTDSSVNINWNPHPQAVAYELYEVINGEYNYLHTLIGSFHNSYSLTSLTPASHYQFILRAKDAQGRIDSNENSIFVSTLLFPPAPTTLTKVFPSGASGLVLPEISVSGVKSGDTISLFTDATCTTLVGSIVSAGSSVVISPTTLNFGTSTFYANASNGLGAASSCSTAFVSYQFFECPLEAGTFIPVAANPSLGTNTDFCVAQYEMRNDGVGNPQSVASSLPWGNLTMDESNTACGTLGAGYSLISNEEWMTVARDIEATASNWSQGEVGQGFLNRGHSNDTLPGPCDSLVENLGADCTTPGTAHQYKRTHTLSNGSIIWDLAGNVSEWVNWKVLPSEKAYISSELVPVNGWRQISLVDTNISSLDKMKPESWRPLITSLSETQNIGNYYSGAGAFEAAAVRGGRWENHVNGGIYSLDLDYDLVDRYSGIGFRCVYKP